MWGFYRGNIGISENAMDTIIDNGLKIKAADFHNLHRKLVVQNLRGRALIVEVKPPT